MADENTHTHTHSDWEGFRRKIDENIYWKFSRPSCMFSPSFSGTGRIVPWEFGAHFTAGYFFHRQTLTSFFAGAVVVVVVLILHSGGDECAWHFICGSPTKTLKLFCSDSACFSDISRKAILESSTTRKVYSASPLLRQFYLKCYITTYLLTSLGSIKLMLEFRPVVVKCKHNFRVN